MQKLKRIKKKQIKLTNKKLNMQIITRWRYKLKRLVTIKENKTETKLVKAK